MDKRLFTLIAFAFVLGSAGSVFADTVNSPSVSVSANVQGVFTFSINNSTSGQSFSFGQVNAQGDVSPTIATTSGVTATAESPSAGSATYEKLTAFTWQVDSAPRRTVNIYISSASRAGTMNIGQLLLRMTKTGGLPGSGTSAGYVAVPAAPPSTDLISGFSAGSGGNTASGNIDAHLQVLDTDTPGTNTWTITLTANGV